MLIKFKLINHLYFNGKKATIEKFVLKAFKVVQKNSKKQSKNLIKLILIFFTPVFKFYKVLNKQIKNNIQKQIYKIIFTKKTRIFLSLNFILIVLKNKKSNFYKKLSETILSFNTINNKYSKLKYKVQKEALLKKHLLPYYRW